MSSGFAPPPPVIIGLRTARFCSAHQKSVGFIYVMKFYTGSGPFSFESEEDRDLFFFFDLKGMQLPLLLMWMLLSVCPG